MIKRVWIFYPPLKKNTGGLVVLLQVARHLQKMGLLAGVLVWDNNLEALSGLPVISASKAKISTNDTLLVPEGWPNALALGFKAGCKCLVYCQNWSYLFHGLPENTCWRDLPVDFIAVSDPVAWYIQKILGKKPAIIRPAIDQNIFYTPASKNQSRLRLGFMPRKNKALAGQIQRIFKERNPKSELEWMAIDGVSREVVGEKMRSCHIFLVTGFPEGCPLPPLEAMLCGCICVGFTGFGGWDYMRQLKSPYSAQAYKLRDVFWPGNGLWFADGDVLGASLGLEQALGYLQRGWKFEGYSQLARAYSAEAQYKAVAKIFG